MNTRRETVARAMYAAAIAYAEARHQTHRVPTWGELHGEMAEWFAALADAAIATIDAETPAESTDAPD